VLDLLAEPGVSSPLVLSGDVHAAGFAELHADQLDPSSPRVALEILTTSISSGGDEADSLAQAAALFENASTSVHYVDAIRRGFALLELGREGGEVTYFAVTTVRAPTADLYVAARFAFGGCQDSCRMKSYAARSSWMRVLPLRRGFSSTTPTGVQFRVEPVQRFGLRAFAFS
jgi:phosphodiesterase/alkaline phosphatase D-like protein